MNIDFKVSATPAVIDHDFDALRGKLTEVLESYRSLVVTEDSMKDARAQATELNKLKGRVADRRKEVAKEAAQPIREFEAKAKELEGEVESARQEILQQMARFEKERLDQALAVATEALEKAYDQSGVLEAFRTADTAELRKMGTLTAKGALTAAAGRTIDGMVSKCLSRQEKVARRLGELEIKSSRAGLVSPITREHVEQFLLLEDDFVFDDHVDAIIKRELRRQEEIQAAAEAPQPAPAEHPDEEIAPKPGLAPQDSYAAPATQGSVYQVTIKLEVPVGPSVTEEAVVDQLRKRLADSGISKTVRSITSQKLSSMEKAA